MLGSSQTALDIIEDVLVTLIHLRDNGDEHILTYSELMKNIFALKNSREQILHLEDFRNA